ncbi:phage tail tape measure protein [Pseudomonas citronellolis]|uniref:phage tail tape measure protein n=1 Tax=Pseudomonas citronellolis TaxID=53408 RepID=UPI0023E3A012|nr:phage tail tape measure protein [Pseudomonas citronellolis]MDF3935342.1 phage tail tape measure protein [Pseudomonas citronellolis]
MANDLRLRVLLGVIDKALGPLKKITQGSGETAKALKAAREQLKGLNAQQKDVSAWRTQRTALEQTSRAMAANQAKVAELARAMGAAGPPTRAMVRDYKRAVGESQRLKLQHDSQSRAVQALRGRLEAAGINTRKFQQGERALRTQITETTRAIQQQEARLRRLGDRERVLSRARATRERTHSVAGKAAMVGAGASATAYGIGQGLYAPVLEGKHFALEESRVAALGLGDHATADAIKFAKAMKTYGTSATDNLTLVRDAMTVFADEHHAQMVAPMLAKMKFANEAMYGEEDGSENERKFMDMLKVIELRGGLASEEEFRKQANIVQKVLTATGGRVGPNEWLNVIKTGGLAAKGLKDEAFYYQLEPLVQEMGGNRVGTALMSAYQNLYQGRTTKRAANNLEQLGLVDPKKLKYDKAGQVAFLDVGAIKGSDLFRSNQFEWMQKVLLPQLEAKGITEKGQVLDTIGSIFSNRTASNLFSQMYLQQAQIAKNQKLNAGADGIDELYNKGLNTAQGKELELLAKRADAYKQMSDTLLPSYVEALQVLTEVIKGVTGWMRENSVTASILLKTAMWVGLLAAAFGGLALTLAGLLGPFAVIRYGMTLFGIQGGAVLSMLRGMGSLLLGPLISGIRAVSIALWGLAANPLVLAIAAVVAVVAGAAYLIYRNWDEVKAYLLGMWAEIKTGFDGGFGGIVTVLANFNPLGLVYRAFAELGRYLGIDLPLQFTEFGNMIVRGLINGLLSGLGQIKDAINTIGDSTITWFKEKLDIHSPSRVFAELGGFTMAGLQQGLLAGQSGPLGAIADVGARLAAAGALALGGAGQAAAIDNRPPISAAAAAPTIMGDTYQITIQATPGSDTAALRRMLEQMLDERERGKAARMRSRLGDRE